jgi:hypothetical protein
MMRFLRNILRFAPAAAVLALAAIQPAHGNDIDLMYIGDGSDNSLKVFAIKKDTMTASLTASFKGTLVKSQGGLHGPRGILIDAAGNLLVSDQNLNTSANGDILLYDSSTGKLLNHVVSPGPNAPTVPRGIVTWTGPLRTDIFVADFTAESQVKRPLTPGRVRAYTAAGDFIGDLDPSPFPSDRYHPRAVVIGPDGLLYVSNAPNGSAAVVGVGGDVLRFNPSTGKLVDVFFSEPGGVGQLNRPEGICFGPDGKLYVTSFRADATDNDTVRIYQGPGGASPATFVGKIDLDLVGQPRAFAQALLFGPGGRLFVPINGSDPTTTGSVRSYNVVTKTFDVPVFVPPAVSGGPLGQPWYLTFGKTNPSTLNYEP